MGNELIDQIAALTLSIENAEYRYKVALSKQTGFDELKACRLAIKNMKSDLQVLIDKRTALNID